MLNGRPSASFSMRVTAFPGAVTTTVAPSYVCVVVPPHGATRSSSTPPRRCSSPRTTRRWRLPRPSWRPANPAGTATARPPAPGSPETETCGTWHCVAARLTPPAESHGRSSPKSLGGWIVGDERPREHDFGCSGSQYGVALQSALVVRWCLRHNDVGIIPVLDRPCSMRQRILAHEAGNEPLLALPIASAPEDRPSSIKNREVPNPQYSYRGRGSKIFYVSQSGRTVPDTPEEVRQNNPPPTLCERQHQRRTLPNGEEQQTTCLPERSASFTLQELFGRI
jgi:hypothetical protein